MRISQFARIRLHQLNFPLNSNLYEPSSLRALHAGLA